MAALSKGGFVNSGRERLQRMRLYANGLLVLMVFIYCLSRSLESSVAAWSWVRAFSEAAMVGALADWFAVTALFRHPLGLPIPHTAIVRKEKQRIGALVGQFVRGSFFTKEEVSRQWQDWQPVRRLAGWLAIEENAEKVVRQAAGLVPALLARAEAAEFVHLGADRIRKGLQRLPVSRLVVVLLQGFLKSSSRRQVLGPILGRLSETVSQNRDWIMDEARKGAPLRGAKILGSVTEVAAMMMSGKAVECLSTELEAASQDEGHALFDKIEEALEQTLSELEGEGSKAWEDFKVRVLADPETQAVLEEVIRGVGRYFLAEASALESGGHQGSWSELSSGAARRFLEDEDQLQDVENTIEKAVTSFIDHHGEGLETMIRRTVESWEANDLIERLENQVGPDLQFIRISGTLIGGCVGLLLHGVGHLIW